MDPNVSESEAQISSNQRLELAAKQRRWTRTLSPLAGPETKPEEVVPGWNQTGGHCTASATAELTDGLLELAHPREKKFKSVSPASVREL